MRKKNSLLRRAWRKLLHWRFRQVRRAEGTGKRGPLLEEVLGRPLIVVPSVFDPKLLRSGAFIGESLSAVLVPPGARVLDLGTGTGVAALIAAEWAQSVVAIDINPEAVRAARINTLLNRLETKIDVRLGDLFAPVAGERFDVVLFNPPFYRGEPRDLRDRAWRSPDLDHRFARDLGQHLKPGGHALVCLSTDGDLPFVDALGEAGFDVEVVTERDLVNEVLRLYRAWPRASSR